ncbi:hypothetical protein FGO68_gene3416 [Halteria grandinella]|uniref:Uncharacterized protein n=1 Tax=Halteria grandinella TaxID=5974 RepID=A0A8J8NTQ1_HALGN|nr:hypothetical protein FGO68_gene3416 [Halteria grandinella]
MEDQKKATQTDLEDSRISQLVSYSISEAARIYSYHREFLFAQDTTFANLQEIEELYRKIFIEQAKIREALNLEIVNFQFAQTQIQSILVVQTIKNSNLRSALELAEQFSYTSDLLEKDAGCISLLESPLHMIVDAIQSILAIKAAHIKLLRFEINDMAQKIGATQYVEMKAVVTPGQLLVSTLQLVDLCMKPGSSVYEKWIEQDRGHTKHYKEYWKDIKAVYFQSFSARVLVNHLANVGVPLDNLSRDLPPEHWKAFKLMEAIVNNPENEQPLNYDTANKQRDLMAKFLQVSLKYINIMRSFLIHKLLSHAKDYIQDVNYVPQTLREFLNAIRTNSKSTKLEQELEKSSNFLERAKSLQSNVNEITRSILDALAPYFGIQSKQNDEKFGQIMAVFQALYVAVCTNMTSRCQEELFQSVKKKGKELFYEIEDRIQEMKNWIGVPAISVAHKFRIHLQFALKHRSRALLIVDPMALSKIFFPQMQFKTLKEFKPSELKSEDVFICNYERPLLNKDIWDSFTVFYVPRYEHFIDKKNYTNLKDLTDPTNISQIQSKLSSVQKLLTDLTADIQTE